MKQNALSLALAHTVMQRFPDPDTYPYRSWCYPQGFLLWGYIRLFEATGDERYAHYVRGYCDSHVDEAGHISGFTGESLDDIMAGCLLLWMVQQGAGEKYRLAVKRVCRAFDAYPRLLCGGFWHGRHLPGELWVDGLFMGGMFLARYDQIMGEDTGCLAEVVKQLTIAFDLCEKDGTGLLYHAYSENPHTPWRHPVSGKAQEVWSEGLGWYAMILVEVLELLPVDFPGRDQVLAQLEKLAAALVVVQHPLTGMWYQVVDKPRDRDNWCDISGTAMFAFSLHKAARLGFLARKYAQAARNALVGIAMNCRTGDDGLLDVHEACDGLPVQNCYDDYVYFTKTVNAKEAVAAVLWAAVEMDHFPETGGATE